MPAILDCAADPGIPALPVVLNPLALTEILHQILPAQDGRLEGLQIRILRYHPGKRCVFEAGWRTAQGLHSWIGKVYAADRSDVYQTMEALRRAGFGPDAEFSIPQPVAYLPELRLLLQEKVAGRSATEFLLSEDQDYPMRVAERCARWLARFHSAAPRSGPILELSHYQVSIERWSRRIAGLGGAWANKAGQLRKRLEFAASRISDIVMCAGHGSFTHHGVIFAGGRTVTLDWDDHALAEPSRDVARFIVGLQRLALRCLSSIRALDAAADVFLRTYLSRFGPEVRANLPFYAAAICLRLAKKDIKHQGFAWSKKAAATLDEGLRVLEQGV